MNLGPGSRYLSLVVEDRNQSNRCHGERTMKFYIRLALSFTMVLAILIPAYAAITGVISGTVTDPQGAVIPGVTVVALNEQTGVQQSVITDGKGFYSFLALGVGSYTITASQPGFETLHETGIKVDANSSVRTDSALESDHCDPGNWSRATPCRWRPRAPSSGRSLPARGSPPCL